MKREAADPEAIAAALRGPGYTPRRRDLGALLELLGREDEVLVASVERGLAALGVLGGRGALERIPGAPAPLRGRLVRVLGRVAAETGDGSLRAALLGTLADADPKARRNAVIALGRLPGDDVEQALLAYWEREERVDHRRSVAASLGKAGGARALALLRGVRSEDAELVRIVAQAVQMLERTLGREARSEIAADARPARTFPVVLRCRAGIEGILARELDPAWAPRVEGAGRVRAELGGAARELLRARTMLDFAFVLPTQRRRSGEELSDVLVRALVADEALEVFRTFTRGALRYRIEWAGAGHRRAATWRVAREVSARRAELVNDPTRSTWEVRVTERGERVAVELHPRGMEDTRFTYRVGEVPGASHPTLAAALVRVAGLRDDDVVWDPFVGSGTELIERAQAGPWRRLVGTDVMPAALAVARGNLAAAGVAGAELQVADARDFDPGGVTLVLANPPMGRRVARGSDLVGLLEAVLRQVARVLRPGGRMVWYAPHGRVLARVAEGEGLRVAFEQVVDLGGFDATLQRFDRPAVSARASARGRG